MESVFRKRNSPYVRKGKSARNTKIWFLGKHGYFLSILVLCCWCSGFDTRNLYAREKTSLEKKGGLGHAFIYYRTKGHESYKSLAKRYGLYVDRIRAYNGNVALKAERLIRLPAAHRHVVSRGDTLTSFSIRYRYPLADLKALIVKQRGANKVVIKKRDYLNAGEVFYIPVAYPSEVWLYSAYIESEYKRLKDIVKVPQVNASSSFFASSRRGGSTSYPKIPEDIQLNVRSSLPFIQAVEEKLNFNFPLSGEKWALREFLGYDLLAEEIRPGVIYKVRKTSTVKASEEGKVIFLERLRGWGMTLVIRHSRTFFTLYGGFEEVETGLGTEVKRGDRLGRIHQGLFFSLYYKGLPIDPLEFLIDPS